MVTQWHARMRVPGPALVDAFAFQASSMQHWQLTSRVPAHPAARAMELGRECLELWGYRRVDELIWVKTNQLTQLARTGRTGHWLNHSKEHCLVGVKGNPPLNRCVPGGGEMSSGAAAATAVTVPYPAASASTGSQ